nr:SIMPL domain-containing protein [uncultured Porphyromonas sp.]
MEKKQIIIASILGIAFVLGLSFAAYQISRIRKVPSEISVTGIAERNFKSDLIVWTATYSVQDYSSSEGYQDLQRIGKEVRNFIEKNNIPDSSYLFSGISISKMYDQVTDGNNYYRQVFSGYNLSQTVTITSQDIDRVEALSRNITELINQGIEITSGDPSYYYTHLNDLKLEMLKESSEDALARAEVIAEGSNCKVGKLKRSQMGVFQIVGQYSDEDYSWGGSFNTSSKYKTASITVKNTYKIR